MSHQAFDGPGVGQIVKDITADVKVLVRDEVQLAKAELVPAAKNAGIGAGMLGVAGYFGLAALSILYFAAAFGLVALGLSEWLAFLIVGVVLLLIAAVLGLVGLVLLRKVKGPKRTIASAKTTVAEVKAAIQRSSAAAKASGDPEIEGEVVAARAVR